MNITNAVDFARYMTKTEALFKMLSTCARLPTHIEEAIAELDAAQGAWPEWDLSGGFGRCRDEDGLIYSSVGIDGNLAFEPGRIVKVGYFVPSDKPFLLREVEVTSLVTEPVVPVQVRLLSHHVKYLAESENQKLSGCWLLVQPRDPIAIEVKNTHQAMTAVLTRMHARGYPLM